MKRFVSRGDVVVVKPNIGWDRMPIHAANTNPDVVGDGRAARLRSGRQAGRRHRRLVQRPEPLLPALGHLARGLRRSAPRSSSPPSTASARMRLKGEVLDEWPVYTPLVNADKVINVPVAKHHNLAKYTGGDEELVRRRSAAGATACTRTSTSRSPTSRPSCAPRSSSSTRRACSCATARRAATSTTRRR